MTRPQAQEAADRASSKADAGSNDPIVDAQLRTLTFVRQRCELPLVPASLAPLSLRASRLFWGFLGFKVETFVNSELSSGSVQVGSPCWFGLDRKLWGLSPTEISNSKGCPTVQRGLSPIVVSWQISHHLLNREVCSIVPSSDSGVCPQPRAPITKGAQRSDQSNTPTGSVPNREADFRHPPNKGLSPIGIPNKGLSPNRNLADRLLDPAQPNPSAYDRKTRRRIEE